MRRKPAIPLALRKPDQFLDDPDARAVGDDMRMHRQLEDATGLIGGLKSTTEDIEHIRRRRIGPERLKAVHDEIDCIVTDPFDR